MTWLHRGQHYKVPRSAHCHQSVPVQILSEMLLGCQTTANKRSDLQSGIHPFFTISILSSVTIELAISHSVTLYCTPNHTSTLCVVVPFATISHLPIVIMAGNRRADRVPKCLLWGKTWMHDSRILINFRWWKRHGMGLHAYSNIVEMLIIDLLHVEGCRSKGLEGLAQWKPSLTSLL